MLQVFGCRRVCEIRIPPRNFRRVVRSGARVLVPYVPSDAIAQIVDVKFDELVGRDPQKEKLDSEDEDEEEEEEDDDGGD